MGRHLSYPGNIVTGTLASSIAPSGTVTFQVTGWPSAVGIGGQPFVVEVGPGLADDEKILVSSFSAGVATIDGAGRGWDGTSAVAHSVGEQVKVVWDATSAQDVDDHLYVTTRDDHSQYLNVARHDVNARHGSSVVSHSQIGSLSADDHTQYLNNARHDAHTHPATSFQTGPGIITRAMLGGAAQGLMVGQLVARPGGISGVETSYLLPADGAAVSRTTWPALFAQYGVTYGAGDGSTTFNVPDCRDRVVIGSAAVAPGGGRSARVEAATGGEETHLLVTGEVPSHTHTATDSGHSHPVSDPQHAHNNIVGETGLGGVNPGWIAERDDASPQGASSSPTGVHFTFSAPGNVSTGAAATGVTTQNGTATVTNASVGGGAAHNIMQPFIAVPVFVVAA